MRPSKMLRVLYDESLVGTLAITADHIKLKQEQK